MNKLKLNNDLWIQDRSGIKLLNLSNTKFGQTKIGSSRKHAKTVGMLTYHGKPCVYGHTEKYTSDGHCVPCRKAWHLQHKETRKKQQEERMADKDRVIVERSKNKHIRRECGELTKEQIHENVIESQKNERRKALRRYTVNGNPMTEHDWLRMYEEQGGKCANRKCTKTSHNRWWEQGHNGLCVDHDHVTNEASGLLCSECNLYEGIIENKSPKLYGVIDYHKKKSTERQIFLEKIEKKDLTMI